MIYTLKIFDAAGASIFSHDIVIAEGFDFGQQVSEALDAFRRHTGRGVWDDGQSLSILEKA